MQFSSTSVPDAPPAGAPSFLERCRGRKAAEEALYQECPVCGRPNTFFQGELGQLVRCQHCSGRFVALDPAARSDVEETLLERAGRLLRLSEKRLQPWVVAGWTS